MFKCSLEIVEKERYNKIQRRERIIHGRLGSGVKRGMCLMKKIRKEEGKNAGGWLQV